MSDLTPQEIARLGATLQRLRGELRESLSRTREGARPVGLDEPIGRLTRIDAIQQQSVSAAQRSAHDLRLRQVLQALNLIERGEYGICRRCEDPIGFPRLSARPESPYCRDCQEEIDHRHAR